MNYIQLPFNFLIRNGFKFKNLNLNVNSKDYFKVFRFDDLPDFPLPEPKYSEENFDIIMEEWRTKCVEDFEFRYQLKEKIIQKTKYSYKHLLETKENPTKTDFCSQFLDDYKFYHKDLIDIWIELWENTNNELESLETLLIFNSFLYNLCLNSKALEDDESERNFLWNEASKEIKEENKYWSKNSYEEGGGGDEWSDPY